MAVEGNYIGLHGCTTGERVNRYKGISWMYVLDNFHLRCYDEATINFHLPEGLNNPSPAVPYGHCRRNATEGYPASAIANLQEVRFVSLPLKTGLCDQGRRIILSEALAASILPFIYRWAHT